MAGPICSRANPLMPPVAIRLCSKSLRPCGAIQHTELVLGFVYSIARACRHFGWSGGPTHELVVWDVPVGHV